MTTRIPTAAVNAAADAILDRADGGAGPALLRIYTGSQPATADSAATGTLLAEVTLEDPAFGAASGGAKTLADPGSVEGQADGSVGWFRVVQSDGSTVVVDGSVTSTGGGGDLEVTNTSIATGQTFDILSGGTITVSA